MTSALRPPAHGRATIDNRLLELLEGLLWAAPMGVALFSPGGRFLWTNEKLAQLTGVPVHRHRGRTLREIVPEFADGLESLLAEALTADRAGEVELIGETAAQPGVRTWAARWYPIREHDRTVAVGAIISEITERRMTEAAKAASDKRLELALEAGEMGTWDWDLRTGHIRWDERTAGIFGIRLEEFDGTIEMFMSRLLHPDDVDMLTAAIRQAIANRGTLRRDYRALHPDGTVHWVSVRGRVISDNSGEPEAMLGVVQDRTDTHSSDERLARTLEHIDEAFYSLDHQWQFTYVNGRAEQLLQRPRDELLGRVMWDLFPETSGSRFQREFESVMRSGMPVTFEERDGPTDRWLEVRVYPDPSGLAVYFRDISDRRRREQERQVQLARQQRAHAAAARLLDMAALFRTDLPPVQAAEQACSAGIAVFECARVAVWQIHRETATVIAQRGGDPLPHGWKVRVDDIVRLRDAMDAQEPTFIADAQAVDSAVEKDLARHLGIRSLIQAPVQLGHRAGTLLTLVSWDRLIAPPDSDLLDVVQRFAQQVALSVEQARRREAQAQAAQLNAELQARLLPAPAVPCPDVEVSSLYRPGERRMVLGGDFYDLIDREGTLCMVIGDVTGHGPDAAALGATLRAGWRTLALCDTPPAEIVAALDRLLRVEQDNDEQLVSLCCAQLSPDRRTLTLASAGHPPPIISTPDGTSLVAAPAGLLLGAPVETGEWETARIRLPERWALLLYTDGLTEARLAPGSSERIEPHRLADYLGEANPLSAVNLERLLQHLQRQVRSQGAEPIEDDVALLLLRRLPQGPPANATST